VGKPESGNLGLHAGITTLANIEFEFGWLATTQSQGDPNNPEAITLKVQQDIPNPSKVHFLLQASWAVGLSQEFGGVRIIFADGRTINEPLKVGYNIRDWSQVNTSLTAPNAQQAWEGVGWDGRTKGVVDMLTIDIPSDFRQSQITQIEIWDESVQKLNSPNPGIHVWAVTVEASTIIPPTNTALAVATNDPRDIAAQSLGYANVDSFMEAFEISAEIKPRIFVCPGEETYCLSIYEEVGQPDFHFKNVSNCNLDGKQANGTSKIPIDFDGMVKGFTVRRQCGN